VIIADSNVWISLLRWPEEPIALELKSLLRGDRVAIVGVVLAEVLQGSRGEREYRQLIDRLEALPYLEMNRGMWAKVGEVAMHLRNKGLATPLTDIAIAAVALEGDHEVFTLDRRHFERIPELRLYESEGAA
jgi:predicted nucleic acid-binding protein